MAWGRGRGFRCGGGGYRRPPSSVYSEAGATLSEKSALSEFPHLEAADLERGRVSGQLTVQRRSCHGNFYWLYQRSQIQAFARTVTPSVAKAAELEAKRLKQLKKTAPKELATVDEQLQALLRKKAELEGLVLQQQQQQQKAKAKRPAAGKRKKRSYDNDDDDSDDGGEGGDDWTPNDENSPGGGQQPTRKSGRTERKHYSDPGEDEVF